MSTLQPVVSACHNFTREETREIVTIVIAPISIRELRGQITTGWACSRGRYCECPTCIYSRMERKNEQNPNHR